MLFRSGWDGRVQSFAPIASSDTYYNSTFFGDFDGVPLVGKVMNGDSGGGVFNQSAELVGLNTAQSGNSAIAGTSIYLDLSQPDVYNWIQSNTVVPEPSTMAMLGLGTAGLLLRRRRR